MKINPISNPNFISSYLASKPATLRPKDGNGRDELTLTDQAISFSKTLEDARESIEMRSPEERAHIAEISSLIAQGRYRIDSDKVAEKILESVYRR